MHINILLIGTLEQIPKYAKFLKEILSNKRRWDNRETIILTEGCSTNMQKKLPLKLKDLGSFSTIPCTIGNTFFDKPFFNLRASINLIPFSIFKKLKLGEVKLIMVYMCLVDRSITYPRGIFEYVSVKVDKFIFLIDFIMLNMDENEEILLILGRPFLAMGGALIYVQQGKLTMRVEDEDVTCKVYKAMDSPSKV